jgi:hypothetical protein
MIIQGYSENLAFLILEGWNQKGGSHKDIRLFRLLKFPREAGITPMRLFDDNQGNSENLAFLILEGWNQKVGSQKDIEWLGCLSFQEKQGWYL